MQARKSALIFANNLVGAFLGLVAVFFMARYVDKDAIGSFAFAFSLLQVATRLADLGFDKAHIKRVSEGADLGDAIATFAAIKMVMTAGVTVLVLVGGWLWDEWFGLYTTSYPVLVIAAAYWFLFQLATIAVQTFNALRRTALSQLMSLMENLGKLPFIVLVAIAVRAVAGKWAPFVVPVREALDALHVPGPWNVEQQALAVGAAYVLGILASLVTGLVILRRHRYPVGKVRRSLVESYVRFALPLAAISLVAVLLRRVDTVMIGYFWSQGDVADYFQAERIVTVILVIPTAVSILFFPLISELAHKGERDGARDVSRSTMRTMSLVVLPAGMFGIVYASEGIHIFLADKYLSAAPTLQWLIVYVVAHAFMLVGTNVLLGFDRPRVTMRVGLLMMGLNFVLNALFIPRSLLGVPGLGLKSTGAAMATAIAQLVGLAIVTVAARRLMGGSLFGRRIAVHLGASVATGFALYATKDWALFGGLDRFWELGIAGALGMALYLGLLIVMREVTRKDLDLALEVAHPGHMARYIRDELRGRP